jgi:nicotinamidase-related amidase
MSLLFLVTVVLAGIFSFAILFALYVLRNMFIPTRGKQIANYQNPTRALLVMDIQESGGNKQASARALPVNTPFGKMIQSVNRLIGSFDGAGQEVVYVRQVFSSKIITRLHGGRILAGRMEPRICRWINIVNNNDFAKNRTDAFSNRQLEQFLIDHQVDEIFLVGLDAAFCVYYTALGALQRGYRVTVVTDAVMTGRNINRVLQRYHKKRIAVMNSQEIVMKINATSTTLHTNISDSNAG